MSFLEILFPTRLPAAKTLRSGGVDCCDCGFGKRSFSVTPCQETC